MLFLLLFLIKQEHMHMIRKIYIVNLSIYIKPCSIIMLYITVEMHIITVYTVVQHLYIGPALLVANKNMFKPRKIVTEEFSRNV